MLKIPQDYQYFNTLITCSASYMWSTSLGRHRHLYDFKLKIARSLAISVVSVFGIHRRCFVIRALVHCELCYWFMILFYNPNFIRRFCFYDCQCPAQKLSGYFYNDFLGVLAQVFAVIGLHHRICSDGLP